MKGSLQQSQMLDIIEAFEFKGFDILKGSK